jgi:hypothetical protein
VWRRKVISGRNSDFGKSRVRIKYVPTLSLFASSTLKHNKNLSSTVTFIFTTRKNCFIDGLTVVPRNRVIDMVLCYQLISCSVETV